MKPRKKLDKYTLKFLIRHAKRSFNLAVTIPYLRRLARKK
jgi:hypothetical protein